MRWSTRCRNTASSISTCRRARRASGRRFRTRRRRSKPFSERASPSPRLRREGRGEGVSTYRIDCTPSLGSLRDPTSPRKRGEVARASGKAKRNTMTEATNLTFASRRTDDFRLVAGVSTAHFVSHFYMLVLPPLFAFVRADYAVSYTEIGVALTMFNAVSAVAQTPAGFLIDCINARLALIAGLLLGAVGFTVAAVV